MKSKLYSRTLAVLLSLILIIGLMPVMDMTAFAAETDKTIQLGTNAIQKGDSVYYGTCNRDMNGYSAGDAIEWQVLNAEKDNCGDEGMFLLSKYLLDVILFCNKSIENIVDWTNVWLDSDARGWCNDFMTSSFAAAEKAGIKAVSKTDSAENLYGKNWAQSYLDQDQVFFLSVREAYDYLSKYNGADELKAEYKNNNIYIAWNRDWWLRSPDYDHIIASGVSDNGYVDGRVVSPHPIAARPAFNLDLNSVLFSSDAVGGKSSGPVGGDSLQSVSDYSGGGWKLTIVDSNRKWRSFQASVHSARSRQEGYEDWSLEIGYTNLNVGSNEYVSALLCDSSDKVLYYGHIAQNSSRGTVTLNIPSGLAAGSYKLKIFSEQCNGDYKTDYACPFKEFELEVTSSGGFGSIPEADHKAGTEWKSDGTNHWKECVDCGEKMNEAPHDFKWITDKEATATEAGSRHQQCTVCGYAKAAVEIPATGTTGDTSTPQTGDDSNITLWLVMLLASGTALVGTVLYNRKKKYSR